MKTKDVDISKLWSNTVDEKPEDYDFWDNKFSEDWDIPFEQTEEETESEEFAPMMNYFYPLPEFENKRMDSDEIKEALDDAGSVTLIEKIKTGETGLALSGGGMDLSWDIVRGYMNLGYLPPTHFCRNLPRFGGDTLTPERKKVLEACRTSFDIEEGFAQQGKKHLSNIEKRLKKEGFAYDKVRDTWTPSRNG